MVKGSDVSKSKNLVPWEPGGHRGGHHVDQEFWNEAGSLLVGQRVVIFEVAGICFEGVLGCDRMVISIVFYR